MVEVLKLKASQMLPNYSMLGCVSRLLQLTAMLDDMHQALYHMQPN